jgi:hypothetical protein
MSGRTFNGRLAAKFNPFDDDYLVEILEATAVAWKRMRHPSESEIEDRITYRLAGRLLNDPHFADLPYDIVPQYWLLGLNGDLLGRLDLRFRHRHSQRDYFTFESKRLHVTHPKAGFSTEYPTYVGEDGMMAFIDGQYCKGVPAGGMLGYVMDGKTDIAWNGLEKRIDAKRNPLKLSGSSGLVKSGLTKAITIAMTGTHLGETQHDLITGQLRMFHLLLPIRYGYGGATE